MVRNKSVVQVNSLMLVNKIYICLLFLLPPLVLWGQEDICIGKKYSLHSTVLQEERAYWVHLPDNYATNVTQTFPVIYLLDGDLFFHSLVGINRAFSSGRRKDIPSFIIVGIISTDRTRDFTPTASAAGRDGKIPPGAVLKGGGSDTFSRFLTEELRGVIDGSFRTNGQNMLVGHSFGGLFTLNTFFKHTELFDTYLALDPSLWWDQRRLSKEAGILVKDKDFEGKSLYVGVATKPRPDRATMNLTDSDSLFAEILPQTKGLRFFKKSFPDETHGTIAIPGILDGFRQLFW